ncbi:flagellar biosynthetic protein FliR [Hellea balneolensis]|uniref:flagellar biosynthetic protein FliR n=1 Tax=Hellea balneolensis TaxID=287478 RepID=UPI0004149316|nr:flagellar biosynthetic protein FliR [Hellea balneolensis]
MDELSRQIIASVILSLRIAPTLAFAPPFTLIRVSLIIRVLLGLALSMWLVSVNPTQTYNRDIFEDDIFSIILGELFIGVMTMLTLQWAFAAILTAGRAIDIQAGYGLALLIDPTTRTQMPLNGTVFAYAAAARRYAADQNLLSYQQSGDF